jgi:hypothetical protein
MSRLLIYPEVPTGLKRHYLDDKVVHSGEMLELAVSGGVWIPGRYEWGFDVRKQPSFRFTLGCGDIVVCRLPPSAELRWPNDGGKK